MEFPPLDEWQISNNGSSPKGVVDINFLSIATVEPDHSLCIPENIIFNVADTVKGEELALVTSDTNNAMDPMICRNDSNLG